MMDHRGNVSRRAPRRRAARRRRRRALANPVPVENPPPAPVFAFGWGSSSWAKGHGSVPTRVRVCYCVVGTGLFFCLSLPPSLITVSFVSFLLAQSLARELAVEGATVIMMPERGSSTKCTASIMDYSNPDVPVAIVTPGEPLDPPEVHGTETTQLVQPRCRGVHGYVLNLFIRRWW